MSHHDQTAKAEAESTAYLLMEAFGFQGDPEWAARYLSLWGINPQDLMTIQQSIHTAYRTILQSVTKELDSILGDKGQNIVSSSWYHSIKL